MSGPPIVYCRFQGDEWIQTNADDPGAVAFKAIGFYSVPDLLNVMNFLCWYQEEDPTVLWGGVQIHYALESLRVLLNMDEKMFNDIKKVALHQFEDATKECN